MQRIIKYHKNDQDYDVIVTTKNIKNIIYRYKDGVFYVSAPIFVFNKEIVKGLDKYYEKLIRSDMGGESPFKNGKAYLFGQEYDVSEEGGYLTFPDGSKTRYFDLEDLKNQFIRAYKKYMIERTRYYEHLMRVNPPYNVKFRKMLTRFGSNSGHTHSICYSTNLYPYSTDILDSLIVHELAHHYERNHSKNFYNIVYKYCPNYKKDNTKLKKRIFR